MSKLCQINRAVTQNLFLSIGLIVLEVAIGVPASAQITPDNSLGGERSIINQDVIKGLPSERITGGASRGTNLFHSFLEFNINEGRGAYFTSPVGIQNIITRVTGSNRSEIRGTLGVLGNANLFFLNPNGLLFGKNAHLDMQGSFTGTTARTLIFTDGSQFSANDSEPMLTISTPLGLQFGQNSGEIRSQGANLSLPSGTTLGLLGGKIFLEGGSLIANQGHLELGSVADNSLVSLNLVGSKIALAYQGVNVFQDIQLSQGANVSVVGTTGDDAQIRGKTLQLTDGSQIGVFSLGSVSRGSLLVQTSDLVELIGRDKSGNPSGLSAQVPKDQQGIGSNLTVNTARLVVRDGAQISASTFGTGDAGNLTIQASESVDVSGNGLFAQVKENAVGNGGNLTITTKHLTVRDQAQISTSTFGRGNAGNLTINASESVDIVGTERLTLIKDTPQLRVFLRDFLNSRVLAQVNPGAIGNAGNLTITTGQLNIKKGGQVSVSNLAQGSAGNIFISANALTLDSSGIFAQTASGDGGNIILQLQQLLRLQGGSRITTEAGTAPGGGNGGNININSRFVVASPQEQNLITAQAYSGRGGNIQIKAFAIFGFPNSSGTFSQSRITASSTLGISGGVTISAPFYDFSRALTELPINVKSGSGLIAQGCQPISSQTTNRFTIKGYSDLPVNQIEVLGQLPPPNAIAEAQGWRVVPNHPDLIRLSAQSITVPWLKPTECHAP